MARIKHGTLAAATVSVVTLDKDYDSVEVLNRGASGDIYFRCDGTNPTVGGDDAYIVTPGGYLLVNVPSWSKATEVRLISAGTPTYTVGGVV